MLQEYKGFYIDGEARMVHPFYPESYPEAQIYNQGRASSIVQVGRFELPKFKMDDKDLAAYFGLELAKMVVDNCLTEKPQRLGSASVVRRDWSESFGATVSRSANGRRGSARGSPRHLEFFTLLSEAGEDKKFNLSSRCLSTHALASA
jgi:hypothetical protein